MKVALIGCGRIARMHATYVRRESGIARLVVCDTDGDAAARLARDFAADGTYDDVGRMLAELAPTVVHVCTPPGIHAGLAAEALRAGAHVLVEKPLALGRAETARLAVAVRDSPATLCVDHNFLFEPEMLAARAWLQEGRIGEVLGAEMFYGVDNVTAVAAARVWARDLPCGRFTDLLPHPLYLLAHLLGDVHGVDARTGGGLAGEAGTPSELRVLLDCERGLGAIHVSLASAPYELALTVRGTAGTIRVDFARQRAILVRARDGSRQLAQIREGLAVGAQTLRGTLARFHGKATGRLRGYPGMRNLIARFYDGLRRGLPPPVGFVEGARVAHALEDVRGALEREPRRAAAPADRDGSALELERSA